jgi:hypothetical protein
VSDPQGNPKHREREIAHNEHERQAMGAARLSIFAVAFAVIALVAMFGWLMIGR